MKWIDMEKDEMPPETGPHRFRMGPWISCAPFENLLHINIIKAADGRAVLQMPFLVDFAQAAGMMHGGALVSLADTAVVVAIKSMVPPKTHFGTVTMTTDYLRPVREGILEAHGRVAAVKGRMLEGQARVFDQRQQPVLDLRATFKIARDARIRDITFEDSP